MSFISDFGGSRGVPYLDLSKAVPDEDLSVYNSSWFSTQKGDGSGFYFGTSGYIYRYTSSGAVAWTVVLATASGISGCGLVGLGRYDEANDRLHVLAASGTSARYLCINTDDGSYTAPGATQTLTASISIPARPQEWQWIKKDSTTFLVFYAYYKRWLEIDTSTGLITEGTTNVVPNDKLHLITFGYDPDTISGFLMGLQGSSSLVDYPPPEYFPVNCGIPTTYNSVDSIHHFGNYLVLTDDFIGGARNFFPNLKPTEFYTAVNKALRTAGITKTIWEV